MLDEVADELKENALVVGAGAAAAGVPNSPGVGAGAGVADPNNPPEGVGAGAGVFPKLKAPVAGVEDPRPKLVAGATVKKKGNKVRV